MKGPDEGISSIADIAQRMGVSGNYASQYRSRLVKQEVIGTRGRGKVAFDMPFFREYVADQAE